MSRKKRRLICDVHDDINECGIELQKIDYSLPQRSLRAAVNRLAKRICKLAKEEAKPSGQAMEDRLNEYEDGIERMGFRRDK